MDDIHIMVPSIPVAQLRPRAVTVAGKARMVGNPTKHPVTAYKATCRVAAAEVYSGPPLDKPLCLTLLFVLPRPKSMIWKRLAMPRAPHSKSRPDLDNLQKSVMDALTGLVWRDDGLVWKVHASKVIAGGDEQPHTEIVIWEEPDGR